jgi:uncharacterized hydantoinase/oxoprolinase family protein
MRILGLDVGNSKVKLCYVESDGVLADRSVWWHTLALPFSNDRRSDFEVGLPSRIRIIGHLRGLDLGALDAVVACSSHAYSYPLLHESVSHLGAILTATFGTTPVYVVAVDGTLTPAPAIQELGPEALTAHVLTNFYGSALLGSRLIRDGISIDIGTTSTEVVPIVDGRIDPAGLATPSEYVRFRYQHHRLGWYGLTNTPLPMIAPEVVTPTGTYQVVTRGHRSDLLFVLHEDVDQRLLREHAFVSPPDREQALAELSELVGLDRRLLEEPEILAVRDFLYERLVERVAGLLRAVVRETFHRPPAELDVAELALGGRVLARPALIRAGFDPRRIRMLSFGQSQGLWSASSAFGMALLGLEHTLGRRVEVR